jgi:hypothetical protein
MALKKISNIAYISMVTASLYYVNFVDYVSLNNVVCDYIKTWGFGLVI